MSVLERDILISFFMFTADLQPGNAAYTRTIVDYMKKLREIGYDGFDLPIAPTATTDHRSEIEAYRQLRQALDDAQLQDIKVTTNVFATRTFDPSSPSKETRELALEYLRSRVAITKALRGSVMAGPVVLPYAVFPTTDSPVNTPIWSDGLQDWLVDRYRNAMPVLEQVGEYAAREEVNVAIEPVAHWETPAPNLLSDLLPFLDGVSGKHVGGCVDTAQVVIGSDNVAVHTSGMKQLMEAGRLHYIHLSAPDRGALKDSWIPWSLFLKPVFEDFKGPYLVEVFNAIPAFINSLRLTRRKFWIPGEDPPVAGTPDCFTVASEALTEVSRQFGAL